MGRMRLRHKRNVRDRQHLKKHPGTRRTWRQMESNRAHPSSAAHARDLRVVGRRTSSPASYGNSISSLVWWCHTSVSGQAMLRRGFQNLLQRSHHELRRLRSALDEASATLGDEAATRQFVCRYYAKEEPDSGTPSRSPCPVKLEQRQPPPPPPPRARPQSKTSHFV